MVVGSGLTEKELEMVSNYVKELTEERSNISMARTENLQPSGRYQWMNPIKYLESSKLCG